MRVALPVQDGVVEADLPVPDAQVQVVRSADPAATSSWESIVSAALDSPIGAPALSSYDLRGKRVAVICDDWGRPTPASRVLPAVLSAVEAAGARTSDVTVLTGSGVHLPMSDEDLTRKVGSWVRSRYRCVSHDAVQHEMTYMGTSTRGTPVWINSLVAQADFRIAVGRIGPHITHGYEGGAKMITPAVSYWLTVLRNHSCNFSPLCEYGSFVGNPSREDVDDIGGLVGLQYIVNFVVNRHGDPFHGFAGHYLAAHRAGVAWGDANVWGAAIGRRADVVIASPGDLRPGAFGASPLELAALGTRPGGTTIFVNPSDTPLREPSAFQREMASWTFDRVFVEHDRRDLDLSPREISDRCKTIRGEYYARRPGETRNVIVVGAPLALDAEARLRHQSAPTLQAAVDAALAREGSDASVVVMPEAASTLPLERLHQPMESVAP